MEMGLIAESLIPIFALIVLGQVLKRYDFPGAAFWPFAEKLTYYILFPALLLYTLATTDLSGLDAAPMAAALIGALGLVAILLILLKPRLGFDNPSFTSLFQGCIRPNTYIGLAATIALYQNNGAALAAIAIISVIPFVNLLSVMALARYGSAHHRGWLYTLPAIAKNPLIIACVLGIILNGYYRYLPWGTGRILDLLGRASLPLGLLIVGAGLDVRSLSAQKAATSLASAMKLLLLPLLTMIMCRFFDVGYLASTVAVLFAALPGAPSSYVLSRQLGGDHDLMAGILTVETALAFVTMPVILAVMSLVA